MRSLVGGLVLALVASSGCAPSSPPEVSRTRLPFLSGGDLDATRSELAAAELPSGTVLVTGGDDGTGDTASTETWDPISAVWTPAKAMGAERRGHVAITIPSGQVVVIGGHATATGEQWDPSTNEWTALANDGARLKHTATLLGSGLIVVAGGTDGASALQAKLFDPSANSWSDAGTMTVREQHAAAHVLSDQVAVFGGVAAGTYLASVEVYDPSANSWSSGGTLGEARAMIASAVLTDGRVLLAGGTDGSSKSTAEIWDPSSNTATAVASMSEARADARAVTLSTGRVLLIGGVGPSGVTKTTELFDPATGAWSAGPSLSVPRRSFAAIASSGGRVLILGGHDGTGPLKSTEVFGGAGTGATCVINEECIEGNCTGGTCDSGTDTGGTIDPESPPTVSNNFSECTGAGDCASGFCVEGVCCDKACEGKCESCSLPTSPGICTLQVYGTDKKNACGGGGGCVGTCDGKGECIGAGAGTQCLPVRCIGPAKGAGAALCTAKGAPCPESSSATFDCTPFACEEALGACRSTCASSANCAPGFLCDAASRSCVAGGGGEESDGCMYGAGGSTTSAFLVALGMLGVLVRRRRS